MLSENDSNWLGQFTFYHNFCHVICDACEVVPENWTGC